VDDFNQLGHRSGRGRQFQEEGRVVVKHFFREVVKFGHYKDYEAACKAWNGAAVKVGLPPVRYYESRWGTMNEVFGEQEFEDSGDIERRFAAADAANDPDYEPASLAVMAHVADGQSSTYVLADLDIG
jgi:hypothetical protein